MKVEVEVDCCLSCPHLVEREVLSGMRGFEGIASAYFCQKIKTQIDNRFVIHSECVFRKKK